VRSKREISKIYNAEAQLLQQIESLRAHVGYIDISKFRKVDHTQEFMVCIFDI